MDVWHYQIMKHVKEGYIWYCLHEVYHEGKKVCCWTEGAEIEGDETPESIIEILEMMLADARKYPVLDYNMEPEC